MKRNISKLTFLSGAAAVLCIVVVLQATAAEVLQKGESSRIYYRMSDSYSFFPGIAVLFDGETYAGNKAGYSAGIVSLLDIDIFTYKAFTVSFLMREKTLYGGKGKRESDPDLIQYLPLDFLQLKYDTGYGYLGFVLDHECYNFLNTDINIPVEGRYRWYGAAVKWQTYGMQTGAKDLNTGAQNLSDFAFLNSFNFMLYAGRSLGTIAYPYRYIFQADVRYDALRIFHSVPYFESGVYAIVDDRVRINRSFETGMRIVLDDVTLNPHAGYSYRHDVDVYNGLSSSFWSAGFRVERLYSGISGIDESKHPAREKQPSSDQKFIVLFPEMHFSASYMRYFFNSLYGYNADVDISVHLLRVGSFTAYGGSSLDHFASLQMVDFFPRYLEYTYRGGVLLQLQRLSHIIDCNHSLTQYREGNFVNTAPPSFKKISFGIKSRNMDPGSDYKSNTALENSANGLMRYINWEMYIERILRSENINYRWKTTGKMRFDLNIFSAAVPYLSPEIEILKGERSCRNYGSEAGLRFFSTVATTLFLKYSYRVENAAPDSARDSSFAIGLRLSR